MLKNLKIGTRLSLGFGILLLFMMTVGWYGIKSTNTLHDEIEVLVEERMVTIELTSTVIDQINIVARATRNMYIDDNKESQAKEVQRIADARKKSSEVLDKLSKIATSEKDKTTLEKITKDIRPVFGRHLDAYLGFIKEEQTLKAKTLLMGDYRQIQNAYLNTLEEWIAYELHSAEKAGSEAKSWHYVAEHVPAITQM